MAVSGEVKRQELQAQLNNLELEKFLMEEKAAACESMQQPAEDATLAEKSAYQTLSSEALSYRARVIYLQAFIDRYNGTLKGLP